MCPHVEFKSESVLSVKSLTLPGNSSDRPFSLLNCSTITIPFILRGKEGEFNLFQGNQIFTVNVISVISLYCLNANLKLIFIRKVGIIKLLNINFDSVKA
jgi:hypothetical protein